ncbi:MAG: hypothetical protein KGJ02_07140 [Verrucomicrobiota bacterium]|nr:hypothetical protein [Verrucomicrobiota bacterium]
MAELIFTSEEQKIRKQWLIFFLASGLYGFITTLIFQSKFLKGVLPADAPMTLNQILLLIAGMQLGMNLLYYYCSYYKAGTKLLTFSLWMFGVSVVFLLLQMTGVIQSPPNVPSLITPVIDQIIGFAALILWFFFNFRLRRVNRAARQREKQLINKETSSITEVH